MRRLARGVAAPDVTSRSVAGPRAFTWGVAGPRAFTRGVAALSVTALCVAGSLLAIARPALASGTATGDQRTVTQPSIPGTCVTLTSALAASSGTFSSGDEQNPPDTSRIQSALDTCLGTGKAVVLAANGSDTAFLSGPLTVGGGEALVIEGGVTLYASLNPADYQKAGTSDVCGALASSDNGCVPFITINGANASVMGTRTSSGTQGLINGRGGQDMYGTSTTWWQLAQEAQAAGEDQNNPRLIQSDNVSNITIYDLSLTDSPNFHIVFDGGTGFTAWGVRIDTPATARNTDGIDPSGTDITITHSYIQDGDDCIAIKAGSYAADNVTISDDHCYGTHGISIGSETYGGVSNVLVENDTLSGTDRYGNTSTDNNGLRIKSYPGKGGTVSTVTYTGICMTGVKHLLQFNPRYSSSSSSSDIPYFTSIVANGVKAVSSASGAYSELEGYDSSLPLGLTLENVDLDATSVTAAYANIASYDTDLAPSGTDVSVTAISGSGGVPSCSFPPFPSGGSGASGYPGGYHQLVPASDGLCLDVFGASTSAGAAIDQWTCKTSGQANQEFSFVPASGGYGELRAENSGDDVAVANGSATAGSPDIIQRSPDGSASSLWLPLQQSDGTYEFQNQGSGLCLDIYRKAATLGQQLDQWSCKNAPGTNQDFTVSG